MIQLTEQASLKVKELMAQEEGSHPLYLRIGVEHGGCSGFSYGMGLDHEKQETDQEFEINGVKVLVDQDSSKLIEGMKIDYQESAMGGGFTIDNPNAIATCGCGSSFRTKDEAGKPEEC